MAEPNELLRAARERIESPHRPGQPMSRAELAAAVCAWIWEKAGSGSALDAHYIAKLERGVVRWPNSAYREGLREVLQVASDDELGFADTWLDWLETTGFASMDPETRHRIEGVLLLKPRVLPVDVVLPDVVAGTDHVPVAPAVLNDCRR